MKIIHKKINLRNNNHWKMTRKNILKNVLTWSSNTLKMVQMFMNYIQYSCIMEVHLVVITSHISNPLKMACDIYLMTQMLKKSAYKR